MPERAHLLHVDASACELDLYRDDEGLWLETEPYVTSERWGERIATLEDVLNNLRETQLPFCELTWLVPETSRPAGHEQLADEVDYLIQRYKDTASQLRFTL